MKLKLYCPSFIFLIVLCLSLPDTATAQTQSSALSSSGIKRGEVEHQVWLQLLVASNIITAKTDYPPTLETVVKQLKSSLAYKNHRLIATYLYDIADNGNLDVSDVTYAEFEKNGGLPTFFSVGISDIKLNGGFIHISKFKFESRKNIFTNINNQDNNADKRVFNTVATGIITELNVKEDTPTIAGTITGGLSDGVLIIIITVKHSEM